MTPGVLSGQARRRQRGNVMRKHPPARTPNSLVESHIDLVGQVVSSVARRYPRHVERRELWNAGALGLVEASRRFDPDQGIPFERYAAIRIRGAILDSTRSRDWAPRSVRRDAREVRAAAEGFESERGQAPSQAELAERLGLSEEELRRRQSRVADTVVLQLDLETPEQEPLRERIETDREEYLPADVLLERELRGTLRTAIAFLPSLQAEVVGRYYYEGHLLQDIATDLGITEARVSQIRGEAVAAIRAFFSTQFEEVDPVADDTPGKRSRSAYLERVGESSPWSRLRAGGGTGE